MSTYGAMTARTAVICPQKLYKSISLKLSAVGNSKQNVIENVKYSAKD